jgi:hypothetical protein
LLRLAWRCLDQIVAHIFPVDIEGNAKDVQAAADEVLSAKRLAASHADKDDEAGALARAFLDKLASFAPGIPDLSSDKYLPTITDRRLEVSLVERSLDRSGRPKETVVGFVDVIATVTIPVPHLSSGIPHRLRKGYDDDEFAMDEWDTPKVDPAHGSSATPHLPIPKSAVENLKSMSWSAYSPRRCELWLDVRATDIPVGQLLRELKTLREYAPKDAVVTVVAQAMDDEKAAMLAHEGFCVVTGELLSKFDLAKTLQRFRKGQNAESANG